jgi:hypothetical protein
MTLVSVSRLTSLQNGCSLAASYIEGIADADEAKMTKRKAELKRRISKICEVMRRWRKEW